MTSNATKLRTYVSPKAIDVGGLAEQTKGDSSPVGDEPQDGHHGWFNAAGKPESAIKLEN
jgi:hypothetical protein